MRAQPARASPLLALPDALRARPAVLAVNAGSSSLKVGLYPTPDAPAAWSAVCEGLEPGGTPRWLLQGCPPRPLGAAPTPAAGHAPQPFDLALQALAEWLGTSQVELAAVAHRIVHGGERFVAPCRLDSEAVEALQQLSPLAPLHQPHNLAGVRAFWRQWPDVPAVGCFDTAFHATLPDVERRLPLPQALADQGLRRYGFHGLSYQFVAERLREHSHRAAGRVLMAHLGNGASLCAMREGRSLATSMGFSALDGLVMGTRCGSLDAGVVLHLWRAGWTLPQVEALLYRGSGLKGVSGESADMRTLRASSDPRARLAIELFVHRARREAGALTAVLGGLDVLAFTGGIGEHDALSREAIATALEPLGLRLHAARNRSAVGRTIEAIHDETSSVEVWVIPTDEGRIAAQAAFTLQKDATP
jgi:acetate kinase